MLAHYLPRMYLKRFLAGEELFVYDRVLRKIRASGLTRVASITDYYILTNEAGERDDSVEYKFFKQIEDSAAPVLDLLDNAAMISDEQGGIATVFFALLCTRVPAFERAYAELGDAFVKLTMRRVAGTPERAAAVLRGLDKPRPYSAAQFAEFVTQGRYTAKPSSNERISMMTTMAEPLIEAFESMDWWLLRSPTERFVTSDGPMGFLPLSGAPQTYGELTPNVQKFITISPQTCLMLTDRAGEHPILATQTVDAQIAKEINRRIADASERFIIASQQQDLEQLLGTLPPKEAEPRMSLIEWYDPRADSSFVISVRLNSDTEFPIVVPLMFRCESCGYYANVEFVVAGAQQAADSHALTDWLDTPCTNCGKTPRASGTRLTDRPINMGRNAQA